MDRFDQLFSAEYSLRGPFLEAALNRKLQIYMNDIWENPAEYKVLMARRMFNLNNVLMQKWDVNSNKQYLTDSIMSNTAFLLSARAIADRYVYSKEFPRILVCDDIMLHGRGIIKLLDKFKRIVKSRLTELLEDVNDRRLEADIFRAVSIYVFASNKNEGLLIDRTKYRLFSAQTFSMNQLRTLSLQISDYLQSQGVANTSYVLTARLSYNQVKMLLSNEGGGGLSKPFQYKGRRQYVFYRGRSSKIIETIRLYFPDRIQEKGGVLTSVPIFGDIFGESFKMLSRVVAQYLERNVRYSQIAGFLRLENTELDKAKAQLLSFLYSILSLADYCRQGLHVEGNELYRILVSGDFNKIISNFDKSDIFRYEILNLFREICMDTTAGSVLWDCLDFAAQDLIVGQKQRIFARNKALFKCIEGPVALIRKKEYEEAEDIFYEVGMDAEYDAFRYYRTGKPFDVERAGYDVISFKKYMQLMGSVKVSQEHSLGCMFGLMDSGLISMNLETIRERGGQTIQTVLKAGELATYVLPRRFSVFVPALALVESQYSKVGKYVRDVIGAFIDYIKDYCYSRNDLREQRELQLIGDLQKKKALLLYIYSAGQKFQDWDIDLRNERKYLSDGLLKEEGELSFEEEKIRKIYYLRLARDFINRGSIEKTSGRESWISN